VVLQVYQKATKAAEAARDAVQRHRATQKAAQAAQSAAAHLAPHLAKGAAAAQAVAAKLVEAAHSALSGGKPQEGTPTPAAAPQTPGTAPCSTLVEAVTATAAKEQKAAAVAGGPPPAAGEVEVGDERHAAEQASAAGQLSDVALYAPGRLLYLRPKDDSLPEEEQRYDLLEGLPGEVCWAVGGMSAACG
jgi:hypothetical protein